MEEARIVIVTGGSFQGKSVIALRVASKYNFSGVITTDMVRNILKVQNPGVNFLSTSTYTLPQRLLQKQMVSVSKTVKSILEIYRERGEHVIIEGMHLSPSFLRWTSRQQFCRICLNNTLPLSRRLILKSMTRSRLRLRHTQSSGYYFGLIDESNVNTSAYLRYANRILEIHRILLHITKENGFVRMDFGDIDDATEMVSRAVENCYPQLRADRGSSKGVVL